MSENYRALTRTYRPRTFDDIVSQDHVSDTLKNAIKQSRLAHAYMFCGPRGVGKTTMARVLARTVNSIEDDIDGESLNQTLNVIEIDAASNNGVDDIRDLRDRVRIPPQNGRYKIYIIDEVHMLSKAAFNALLKTLEEPPDHVIFIFATTEPHKVLPTILSRVQRFDFKRISIDEIVPRLADVASEEGISIDHESLHVIAKKADGALRDALGLMDQAIAFCGNNIQHEELLRALNVVSTDRMFQFMETVEKHDAGSGIGLINELLQEGYDIQEFLIGLTEHIRNLYVAKISADMHLVEASPDTKKRYKETSDSFSQDDLMRMLHIVSEAQYKIKEAHQPKIQFEITLLKLIHMERTENLNRLLAELDDLKKKLSNSALNKPPEKKETAGESRQEGHPVKNGQQHEEKPSVQKAEENSSAIQKPNRAPTNGAESKSVAVGDDSHNDENKKSDSDPDPDTQAGYEYARDSESGTEPEPVPVSAEDADDHFDMLFGTPSLGSAKRRPASVTNGTSTPTQTLQEQPQPESKPDKPKVSPENVSLQTIKDSWDEYVETLRQYVPQILYFQMQRLEPVKLKNRDLILRCNDDFSKKIVAENKRQLGKILEGHIGVFLQFDCRVQKTKQQAEESMSPYERFKKLQERDPTIKALVELFGAELDYNLNQ